MAVPSWMKYTGLTLLLGYAFVSLAQPLLTYNLPLGPEFKYDANWMNIEYHLYPSQHKRLWRLLGLTIEECELTRELMLAGLVGALIGAERIAADRPAGIRTNALVSMGACCFTISSTYAFRRGPMNWDSSRISAAIPAGVGFLGGGVIWKDTASPGHAHVVRGITSAASVWLSAACGVAVGGALYIVAIFTAGLCIFVLRYAPHSYFVPDALPYHEGEEEEGVSEPRRNLKSLPSRRFFRHQNSLETGGSQQDRQKDVEAGPSNLASDLTTPLYNSFSTPPSTSTSWWNWPAPKAN